LTRLEFEFEGEVVCSIPLTNPAEDSVVRIETALDWEKWLDQHDIKAEDIKSRFKTMCSTKTAYVTLNLALKRMGNNHHELLRVLDKPYLSLHNNVSERDIRDYVKKRKISGSTRSEAGRKCRDTFASLKKTCLKHKISFWHYLKDRLLGGSNIPPLSDFIRAVATWG
jgi:hypothetical protein